MTQNPVFLLQPHAPLHKAAQAWALQSATAAPAATVARAGLHMPIPSSRGLVLPPRTHNPLLLLQPHGERQSSAHSTATHPLLAGGEVAGTAGGDLPVSVVVAAARPAALQSPSPSSDRAVLPPGMHLSYFLDQPQSAWQSSAHRNRAQNGTSGPVRVPRPAPTTPSGVAPTPHSSSSSGGSRTAPIQLKLWFLVFFPPNLFPDDTSLSLVSGSESSCNPHAVISNSGAGGGRPGRPTTGNVVGGAEEERVPRSSRASAGGAPEAAPSGRRHARASGRCVVEDRPSARPGKIDSIAAQGTVVLDADALAASPHG